MGLAAVPASGAAFFVWLWRRSVWPVGALLVVPAVARGATGLGVDVWRPRRERCSVRASAGRVARDAGPPGRSSSGPRTPRASYRGVSNGRRERWKTGHPQQGRGPRGTGDRRPPPAWNATSATSGMTSRTRTRMSREAGRLGERAATGQMETTASAMTTGKTSHLALELTANTKRPPGRAARRSVEERPARRSEGQAHGAEAAMWCPERAGTRGWSERVRLRRYQRSPTTTTPSPSATTRHSDGPGSARRPSARVGSECLLLPRSWLRVVWANLGRTAVGACSSLPGGSRTGQGAAPFVGPRVWAAPSPSTGTGAIDTRDGGPDVRGSAGLRPQSTCRWPAGAPALRSARRHGATRCAGATTPPWRPSDTSPGGQRHPGCRRRVDG